jgi:hypothetical protein
MKTIPLAFFLFFISFCFSQEASSISYCKEVRSSKYGTSCVSDLEDKRYFSFKEDQIYFLTASNYTSPTQVGSIFKLSEPSAIKLNYLFMKGKLQYYCFDLFLSDHGPMGDFMNNYLIGIDENLKIKIAYAFFSNNQCKRSVKKKNTGVIISQVSVLSTQTGLAKKNKY